MDIPFIYGEIASGKNFRDHTLKTNSLVQYFASLINTIIISPLSWGKSSLVNKAEFAPLRLCETYTALVEQLSLLFVTITKTLTTQQLN